MKIISNKKVTSILNPKVGIYIISNDSIYISKFLIDFKLTIPYTLFQFKGEESFLEEIQMHKTSREKLSIIISDYNIKKDNNFSNKNGLDIYKSANNVFNDLEYILLYNKKDIIKHSSSPQNLHSIIKNNNSHLRIQNFIYTLYNKKNIRIQSHFNKRLFSILISIITTILLSFIFIWTFVI